MKFQTTLSKTWKRRQTLITVFLFAVALWFFYDGLIHYPKLNVRYDRFKELEVSGRDEEWERVAKENNWPRKIPHKRFSRTDLAGQMVFGGLSLGASLAAGTWFLLSSRQRLFADEESIHGADGKTVRIDWIKGLDRRKWESKGIVYAIYQEAGAEKRLILDDYKFEGAEAIIGLVEARLSKGATGTDAGTDENREGLPG